MMETLYINQRQCQIIIKDPEKTQDPAGIQTQDLLITTHELYIDFVKKHLIIFIGQVEAIPPTCSCTTVCTMYICLGLSSNTEDPSHLYCLDILSSCTCSQCSLQLYTTCRWAHYHLAHSHSPTMPCSVNSL